MNMRERCTITINVGEGYDQEWGFELEDVVKNAWSCMIPFFTRRHHVRSGEISLEDGAVQISWRYELADEPAQGMSVRTDQDPKGLEGEAPPARSGEA